MCRARGVRLQDLQASFDQEQDRLKDLKEGKSFTFFYDESKTNLDIWRDLNPEIRLSLEFFQSIMFISMGLSGSGKTHTLLKEDGLVINTLKLLYPANLEIRVCEVDAETNKIRDLLTKNWLVPGNTN